MKEAKVLSGNAKSWQIERMNLLHNAVYGAVPRDLINVPRDSIQCSPQMPGAVLLDDWPDHSCSGAILHAPSNTIERRTVLALALRALSVDAPLTVCAANTKGGARLADELKDFGCVVETSHKRRHQIVTTTRPEKLKGIDAAIAAGAPRLLPELNLWSQPGLFNWDRIDPGSQLLQNHLPPLSGVGADLGCGIGVLAWTVCQTNPNVKITLIDIDNRALAMARRNVRGINVDTLWADIRTADNLPSDLDFAVSNPPFHSFGEEDKSLGQTFIERAARILKPGGTLWLTANRHLPYEATLRAHFEVIESIADANGYKVYAARTASQAKRNFSRAVRK